MTEPAHSLRNTILLLAAHLGLDPKRLVARMSRRCRFGRIAVTNRVCVSVRLVDAAGAEHLGVTLPAYVIDTTSHAQASSSRRVPRSSVVIHVRTYRDGAGVCVRYVDADTVDDLLKRRHSLTGRMEVPLSDGMRERLGHRWDGAGSGIGLHPADI